MNKNNFDLLMKSLEEARDHVKGKKAKARVTKWEIISVTKFSSDYIKTIRHKVGLSQPLFAEFLGVSVKTVRAWEQGITSPSGSSARLLEALDKSKEKCLALYKDIKVIRAMAG